MSKLNPHYISGFVDGEGCFAICIGKHRTLKTKTEIKLEFEIELVEEDREILERIRETLGCGNIYTLNYDRYGWRPHVKYKVQRISDFTKILIPFFRRYPLQAKKKRSFLIFAKAVRLVALKKHLDEKNLHRFVELQKAMRQDSKKRTLTARVRENRLPSGV